MVTKQLRAFPRSVTLTRLYGVRLPLVPKAHRPPPPTPSPWSPRHRWPVGRWHRRSRPAARSYRTSRSARRLITIPARGRLAGRQRTGKHPPATGNAPARLARFDGVLLPGGGDLAPHRYGAVDTHAAVYDVDDLQDTFDLEVARTALDSGLALLAICRGLQVVNVALGGSLEQDMGGPEREHRHLAHPVEIERGTLLERATGAQKADVSRRPRPAGPVRRPCAHRARRRPRGPEGHGPRTGPPSRAGVVEPSAGTGPVKCR